MTEREPMPVPGHRTARAADGQDAASAVATGTAPAVASVQAARAPGRLAALSGLARPPIWATVAVFAAGGVLFFLACLRMSWTVPANSDGAANALQAWDMLHGNLLLHGWSLSDVSFYTTELPQYMLVEAVRGLNSGVVHVAAAMTYTLLVLVAALLAKGRAAGFEAVTRMALAAGIMLAPQLRAVPILLLAPDHVGTAVPVLVTWLVLDRAGRRRWVPVVVGVLLAWALVADTLVLYIGVLPLVLVCAARAYQQIVVLRRRVRSAWYDLALAAAGAAAVPAAAAVAAAIRAHGGYHTAPLATGFVGINQAAHNVLLAVEGIPLLYGADFFGLKLGLGSGLILAHLAGVALAGWAVWVGVRRFFRESEIVMPVLVAGLVINLAAYIFGPTVVNIWSTREIAAVLPFGAVLAARVLAGRLITARLVPLLLILLLGYGTSLAYSVAQAPHGVAAQGQPPDTRQLANWLADRHFGYGLAGYWQANAVSLASGGQVLVRPVCHTGGNIVRDHWESRASWYDPAAHVANFLITDPYHSPCFHVSGHDLRAAFGAPVRTYRVGQFTVLVWDTNLLAELNGARAVRPGAHR